MTSGRHRFFVRPGQVQGDVVTFSEEQAHKIRSVLRLRSGDRVRVFDGVVPMDRVVELVDASHGCLVGEWPQPPEPATHLVVYPALLQRDKFEAVLQKLTEIGAAAIVPVLTARSLVRQAPDEHRQVRWRAILREATEQSGRGIVPQLGDALAFEQAIRHAAAEGSVVVMAYEGERRRSLRQVLDNAASGSPVSLFVGPEGGYEPAEAGAAEEAGARLITLGPRVLRSETASPVLAALVLYELDRQT